MKRLSMVADIRRELGALRGTVGLVPTMGFLHAGHMALVQRARQENDVVVVTIFVNPTQFGPGEDLGRYPRDLERDLGMLEAAGVDVVFTPLAAEIYPEGFSTYVSVEGVSEQQEGSFRPGHFRGVATVVAKLFNIIPADRAYFGQKDAQQVVVIKTMARDLNFRHEIVVVPTVRDAEGLALSSRNVYLGEVDRRVALAIPRALARAAQMYELGEHSAEAVRSAVMAVLQSAPGVAVDYVAVCDPETLDELETIGRRALVAVAARVGRVRLIDNTLLEG